MSCNAGTCGCSYARNGPPPMSFNTPPPLPSDIPFSYPEKPSNYSSQCGYKDDFQILSPGRSGCDYAARRMWAAANEPQLRSTTTCGNIIPRVNSHRRTSSPPRRGPILYHHCEGMVPNYTGHVPGEQFRIDVTFGSATRNPLHNIQPKLLRPLCNPVKLW